MTEKNKGIRQLSEEVGGYGEEAGRPASIL